MTFTGGTWGYSGALFWVRERVFGLSCEAFALRCMVDGVSQLRKALAWAYEAESRGSINTDRLSQAHSAQRSKTHRHTNHEPQG